MAAAGAVAGSIVALLATPRRGSELRRRIIDFATAQLNQYLKNRENQPDNTRPEALQENTGTAYG